MSYKVLGIPPFERQLKRLIKEYPSLKIEIAELGNKISENPFIGSLVFKNCYKIRIAIASKGKGKSGGGRVIIYVQLIESTVYLLSIYDQAERDNISNNELAELLKFIS